MIWKCIWAFLKSANAQNDCPQTLAQLLNAVKLDLDCRIPMYLSNYSACESVSHSLKPSAYRRLHGIEVDFSLDAEKLPTVNNILEAQTAARIGKADEKGMHNNVIQEDTEPNNDLESRWLGVLRSAMKGEDRDRIVKEIDHLLVSQPQGFGSGNVGALFAGFVKWMFSLKVNNHNLLSVRTARSYVISVSIRLGGLIGQDLTGFGAEEWVGLYEEALDGAETQNLKRKLVRSLEEFQNFLEHDHGIEAISRREIFWIGKGLVPVDANVISESEFEKIRSCFTKRIFERYPGFSRTQSADDYAEIAWLILTLSYRCGLRRMEALKLDTVDVLIEYFPELLVRPTQERTLKSKSSTRKIPLYALLKPEELDRLRVWVQKRIDGENKSSYSRFLFSLPRRGFLFVPQDQLFKLLHEVMREVTGDSKVRFHHLRHSFGSRMCVMLALGERWKYRRADDITFEDEFSAQVLATLPGYAISMEGSHRLRESLLGHGQLSRLNLWAVCELLGHSGPDVSVEHYIHHLDILLAQSMAESPMAPDLDVVVKASDASGS